MASSLLDFWYYTNHFHDMDGLDARNTYLVSYEGRSLEDVAPTILGVLEIAQPAEMTGTDLRCM